MSQPAYIYARYSSAEQSKGHSLTRQLEDGREYIKNKGWLHDPARELTDKGRSAYHGKNRSPGTALYDFEQKAKADHFLNGVVLAVENIDRLTRQGWRAALDLITDLTRKGVTIAVWQSGRVFEAFQEPDMVQVIELVVTSDAARKLQADKGDRVAKAWNAKIENAAAGSKLALTKIVPGWLDVDALTKAITPNPHRVAVLNEIYDWYCDGKSLPWIERELNGRGERNWGRGKHGDKSWNVSTLHKYLTTRKVLGEYAPKVRLDEDKGRVSRGFVVPDFYPQVVDTAKFNRVQTLRKQRQGWSAKKGDNFPNLFTGLATCAECGGRMNMAGFRKAGQVVRHKRRSGQGYRTSTVKETRGYLTCSKARRNDGCTSQLFLHYQPLEAGVLRSLWDLAMRGEFTRPSEKLTQLTSAVADQERHVALKQEQLDRIVDNLMQVSSAALAQRAKELEDEITVEKAKLDEARKELALEQGKAPPQQDLDALTDARRTLDSPDDQVSYAARVKANQALRGLVQIMEIDAQGKTMLVLGNYAVGMTFDREGNHLDTSALKWAQVHGPDGEADWHPDAERVPD